MPSFDARRRLVPLSTFIAICLLVTRLMGSPNVIVILADDQGWGDLSIHGHPSIQTPHLDQLARDGARFERFYVQPVCAPTRAEFLTGRYHLRSGVRGVSRGRERMSLQEETIAEVFRRAGYATGCFGKWHSGTQYPYHPNGRGFDEFYGFTSGHWGNYFDAMMDHNGDVVQGRGYITDDVTHRALEFAQANVAEGTPFFIHLALPTPHSPMQVPDAYWDTWDARAVPADHRFADQEDRAHTRAALAMVENIDANIGRLLEGLAEAGAEDDTIVMYFSDNGPNGRRWNGDFKGVKGHTDEGGVRSALFVRWPAQIPAAQVMRHPAGAIDLLPTLMELAGLSHVPARPLDGVSLAPALRQMEPETANRWIFSHWNNRVSVRGERWMMDHEERLFDLATDPGQLRDASDDFPEIAAELRQRRSEWIAEMPDETTMPAPAFTIGHAEARFSLLPARDATLHGELERSNRFPNDSYVRNWRRPEDRLSWEVDVLAAGRFAATVYYTCAAADVGATLQLDCGAATVRQTVGPAWDPPELGAENDRVPRQESYVKQFKPLKLGEVELAAGPAILSLHCPDIPGKTALEFRLLQLERVD